jgi:predicted transposase YdaD
MGLRSKHEVAAQLLEGVQNMRESTTYQAILREGREEGRIEGRVEGRNEGRVEGRNEGRVEGRVGEAQRMLLMLGETRFGAPDEATRGAIESIDDVERLERMTKRVLDTKIHDWDGLLGTP